MTPKSPMTYKHKVFGASIKLDKNCPKDKIYLLMRQAHECSNAQLIYAMKFSIQTGYPYRRYRRGSNRCLRCGLFKHDGAVINV